MEPRQQLLGVLCLQPRACVEEMGCVIMASVHALMGTPDSIARSAGARTDAVVRVNASTALATAITNLQVSTAPKRLARMTAILLTEHAPKECAPA